MDRTPTLVAPIPIEERREDDRFRTLVETLAPFARRLRDRRVLDFGAGDGLSTRALLELGAKQVIAVDSRADRVERGVAELEASGCADRVDFLLLPHLARIPLLHANVDAVLANGVLQDLPAPRGLYLRELWRVLAPGGPLLITATQNPWSTLDLRTKRWNERGVSYREIARGLHGGFIYRSEGTRLRHRLLGSLGLPGSLFDPFPVHCFEKPRSEPTD